jgi:LPXTG-motif cell wall-anchored protein
MMKTMDKSPRCAKLSSAVLRYSTVVLFCASIIWSQSQVNNLSAQANSSNSGKRPPVATLRSSDSPEGSRVAVSSNQSLNDYEAYRRGDRFYIKIPAAEVPRTEALRGRGFADVKAQRNGDSTLVSFRLLPGATARVEQRSNRLDVVFTVPGGNSAVTSNSGRDSRSTPGPDSNRDPNANKRTTAPAANKNSNSSSARTAAPSSASNSNAANPASRNSATPTPAASAALKTATPSPVPTATGKTAAQKSSQTATPLPANQPTPASANQQRQDRWSGMKERVNYWILLAQLNPIPVAVGVALLLLLFGFFLLRRRRSKTPRRTRSARKAVKTAAKPATATSVRPLAESEPASIPAPVVAAAAVAAPLAAASSLPAEEAREVDRVPTSVPAAIPSPDPGHPRRERVTQASDAVKNLMNGGSYDKSIIGSDDPETRQLVGAELLAAIVGRNDQRREYARAAFIKYGYFDDATRDLRTAESANERAAAARRLSFVHDSEATPHLIGALEDSSPDVRRSAVEALMDLRDPAAIGPLNALMQTENDRKVPRTLIKQAIDVCATAAPAALPKVLATNDPPRIIPESSSPALETEREVIEL